MNIQPMTKSQLQKALSKRPVPAHVDAVCNYWNDRLKEEFASFSISPDYDEGIVVIKAYHEPGRFDRCLDMCIQVEEFYKDNRALFPENELDNIMEELER